MDLSDRGNPVFESAMGVVRGAKLEYAEQKMTVLAAQHQVKKYMMERFRLQLAQTLLRASLEGMSLNAIAEAYDTKDHRTISKFLAEATRHGQAMKNNEQYFTVTKEDFWWL